MKPWKTLLVLATTSLLAFGCGSGGGGGISGSASGAIAASMGLTDRIWYLSNYSGCALAVKFSASGEYLAVFACAQTQNFFRYEQIQGSYEISGSQIKLTGTENNCSGHNTFFWDATGGDNTSTFEVSLKNDTLYATSGNTTFALRPLNDQSVMSYVATRSCYLRDTNSWINYDLAPSPQNMEDVWEEPTQPTIPDVVTPPSTEEDENSSLGAPLSYEFKLKGHQTAATPVIHTDGVLKVKFRITPDQGNAFHQATELSVKIAVGETEITPTFTNNNYPYGMVGETSNVINLSSYITQGQGIQIHVKSPKNDFYCTYRPNPFYYYEPGTNSWQPTNPYFNNYPGCRKAVFVNSSDSSKSHDWGGVLIVQTSNTTEI